MLFPSFRQVHAIHAAPQLIPACTHCWAASFHDRRVSEGFKVVLLLSTSSFTSQGDTHKSGAPSAQTAPGM